MPSTATSSVSKDLRWLSEWHPSPASTNPSSQELGDDDASQEFNPSVNLTKESFSEGYTSSTLRVQWTRLTPKVEVDYDCQVRSNESLEVPGYSFFTCLDTTSLGLP